MNDKKANSSKAEEPITAYKTTSKQNGIGENFDFDKEFAKGLTVEEVKAEMHKRIKSWNWEK